MSNPNRTILVLFAALLLGTLLGTPLGAAAQTLVTPGWPYTPMPSEQEQAEDPTTQAYAEALSAWLEANPGVELREIEFDIWNQQVLLTGIAGSTAPSWFFSAVLGGWSIDNTRTAFAQGLAADITDELERYGLLARMPDNLRALYQQTWETNGRYYSLPFGLGVGQGVHYRKDLIAELGLEEPTPDWSWDDFRALAKALTTPERKGAAVPTWIPNAELDTNGFALMTRLPVPDTGWHWRWDYTSGVERWAAVIERWRAALYDDESLIMDPIIPDGDLAGYYVRGDVAMLVQDAVFFFNPPNDPTSASALADSLGRPLDEVAGWVPLPRGELDTLSRSQASIGSVSFNPDASRDVLDKAVGLFDFMHFGEGLATERRATFARFEDLRYVFHDRVVSIVGEDSIAGIPGSATDAYGESAIAHVNAVLDNPLFPAEAAHFPVETESGPSMQAFQDAMSVLLFSPGSVDIETELERAEQIVNQQAASFVSGTPDDVFLEGAQSYYAAVESYYLEHSPDFYTQVYQPWFEAQIVLLLNP